VRYQGIPIHGQRVDLVVEDLVVVEMKAVKHFDDIHQAQLVSYLRTTGLRAGLLINFRVPLLHRGLKRVVL
jgi:GxxExxY protein